MKIEDVKKLDNGVSGISIEGKIIKTPKEPRDSEYGWSQMVILKDDTDEISSWINIESEEDAYKVGQYISIKGKVSKYVKGGKPGISLNGNVIDEIVKEEEVSQEQPISQPNTQSNSQPVEKTVEKEYTKENYWRDKALRDIENNKCIVRECAIKAATEFLAGSAANIRSLEVQEWYFEFTDKIVDYINKANVKVEIQTPKIILLDESIKEFGGTAVEEKPEGDKEQKIAQTRELVRNPHLAEPIDDTMATVKQKKQIYGYINKEGKKIGGMVDSQYIKKGEVKNIGKAQDLTKKDANRYWDYWYGEDGERNKRELEAKEKEKKKDNPFATERQPLEKIDPKDDTPLTKEVLIDDIQDLRKENYLKDDEKFSEAFGCNAKFELWTEKELTKLKEKLRVYRPSCLK